MQEERLNDIVFGFSVFKPTEQVKYMLRNMMRFIKRPVIVIDNTQNETDREYLDSLIMDEECWASVVKVEVKEDNLFKAFNTILDIAASMKAQYAVIQNWDIMYLGDDFCDKVMDIMAKDLNIGILCPFTNNTPFKYMEEIWSNVDVESWYKKRDVPLRWSRVFHGDYINMVIRLGMVNEVGKFDEENFGKYGALGEMDYGYRMEQKGYYWAITDSVLVHHFGAVGRGCNDAQILAEVQNARYKFTQKYGEGLAMSLINRKKGP
jgi:GT2 family glycosyltransferase